MPQQQEARGRLRFSHRLESFRQISTHALCSKCVELTTSSELCEIKRANGTPWELGNRRSYDSSRVTSSWSSRWFIVCEGSTRSTPSQQPLSLADACKVIEAELRIDRYRVGDFILDGSLQTRHPFQHHKYDEFRRRAANDCTLCRRFHHSMSHRVPPKRNNDTAPVQPDDCIAALCFVKIWSKLDGGGDRGCLILMVFVCTEWSNNRKCVLRFDHDVTQLCEAQNLPTILRGRQRPESLVRVKQWLRNCRKNHSCSLSTKSIIHLRKRMPRRLLKISSDTHGIEVYLVEPPPADATYGTLSYCWGANGVPLKLTGSNYDKFVAGLTLEGFPRTLREAILTMMQLEIEYIWIDALCIIQDSKADWVDEATRMPYIYGYGEVNIAATASADSTGGLFVQSPTLDATGIVLGWKQLSDCPNVLVQYDIGAAYNKNVQRAHLSHRGWAFQEQALAPRTIHFAVDHIWVECREYCANEIHAVPDQARARHLTGRNLAEYGWMSLVNEYSHRLLTYPSDRLVALAGIAEIFGRARGYDPSEYHAGLWRGELPSQLLWSMIYGDGEWPKGSNRKDDVAPSWSWATRSGRRRFDHPNDIVWEEWHQALKVLDISVSPSAHSRFGAIDHGELSIACCLHPMILQHPWGDETEPLLGISGHGYCSYDFEEARRITRERNITEGYYSDEENDFNNNLFMISAASRRKHAHLIPPRYWETSTKHGRVNHKMASRDVARFKCYGDDDGPGPDLHEFTDCYYVPMVKRTRRTDNPERRHVIIGLVLVPHPQRQGLFRRRGLLEIFYPYGFEDLPAWWLGGSGDLGDMGAVVGVNSGICTVKIV